jgi:hypothetical protein
MVVAVAVLSVVLVASLVWGVTASRAAKAGRAKVAELEGVTAELAAAREELATTTTELSSARATSEAVSGELASVRDQLGAAQDQVASGAAELGSTRDELTGMRAELAATSEALASTTAEVASLTTELEATAAELVVTTNELAATTTELGVTRDELRATATEMASTTTSTATGAGVTTWPLERRRLGRLWRERVAIVADGPSPLDGDEPVRAAIEVLTEASREESGVPIDLVWSAAAVPERVAALLVLVVEELVAVARSSEGGELLVSATDDGRVEVEVRTEPATVLDAESTAAMAAVGAEIVSDGGRCAVRL